MDGLLDAPVPEQPHAWRSRSLAGLALSGVALIAIGAAAPSFGAAAVGRAAARPVDAMSLAQFAQPDIYKSQSHGLGAWYDPTVGGAETCGFHNEWAPPGVSGLAALNLEDFNRGGKMTSCGMCIQVWTNGDYPWNGQSGGGSLPMTWDGDVFFVTDACASCAKGGAAFALKPGQGGNPGPQGNGKWEITWQAVPCPTDSGPEGKGKGPLYMLDSGDNQYWVKVRPMNLHYPVASIAFMEGGKYKEGHLGPQTWYEWRPFGFEWQPSDGPATLPLKIRVTSVTGELLYDELPKLDKWVEGSRGAPDFTP